MTDNEILEKYHETIETNINLLLTSKSGYLPPDFNPIV